MTALPSTLALDAPADGTTLIASRDRNNDTSLQTGVNGLIAALSGGSAGQTLTALTSTSVDYEYPPGHEYAYTEFTSPVSCAATSEATATQIVAASAVTFDGSTAVWIEFYAPNYDAGDGPVFNVYLYDGSGSIGNLSQRTIVASTEYGQLRLARRLTPSAAAHTYSVRGSVSAGGGVSVKAGAGGVGNFVPGFIRISKA